MKVIGCVLGFVLVLQAVACTAASVGDDDDGNDSSDVGGQCKQGERATDFARCESDDECYSGYCCILGVLGCGHQGDYPGYCSHPNTSAYNAGHGYSCDTDDDCAAVAPAWIEHGGSAHCYKDAINNVSNGCGFDCSRPASNPTGGAGTSNDTAGSSGTSSVAGASGGGGTSGGEGGVAGGTSAGGTTSSAGTGSGGTGTGSGGSGTASGGGPAAGGTSSSGGTGSAGTGSAGGPAGAAGTSGGQSGAGGTSGGA